MCLAKGLVLCNCDGRSTLSMGLGVLFMFLICVCLYQAQTDGVDVDVPNSDSVTAVMLAVREIDLFEGITALLPWEHRPVEVVKGLLGLFA